MKVIQEQLGHKDIRVTTDVYAETTKDLKKREVQKMEVENSDVWVVWELTPIYSKTYSKMYLICVDI